MSPTEKIGQQSVKTEVYRLDFEGLSSEQIANKLKIGERSVRRYKSQIAQFTQDTAKEFLRLMHDVNAESDPDKCIFPDCMDDVVLEITIKRGLRGLCNFHWSIIADSDAEWSSEELKQWPKL